jgi:hypothetical protein
MIGPGCAPLRRWLKVFRLADRHLKISPFTGLT